MRRILLSTVAGVTIVAAGCSGMDPDAGQGKVQDLSWHFQHVVCEDPHELYGCKPTMIDAIDRNDLAQVKQLVEEEGIDVNIHYPYYYGLTALMAAAQDQREDIALYLLEQGAKGDDVIPVDPLKIAEGHGMDQLAEVLRAGRK